MALIPPRYLNSVVSIEVERTNDQGEAKITSVATGFLVGKAIGKKDDKGTHFRAFLVTNRHVFYNKRTGVYLDNVFLRFNTLDNKSHYFKVNLLKDDKTPLWSMHTDEKVDLAVLPLNGKAITDAKIDYFLFNDKYLVYAKCFKENNISTGDGLFVLGFPMSISGKTKNCVIARQGIIARVDEEVLEERFFYIDASAYPGNSGGPVISKPELVAVQGTRCNSKANLIGVISSGETFSDIAISQQTGEPKIIFTEQTGLVRVVPIELACEIIDDIIANAPQEAKVEETNTEAKD